MASLQEASERIVREHEARITYDREAAELDLKWQHNHFYDFAAKLQDDVAADFDALSVCPLAVMIPPPAVAAQFASPLASLLPTCASHSMRLQ